MQNLVIVCAQVDLKKFGDAGRPLSCGLSVQMQHITKHIHDVRRITMTGTHNHLWVFLMRC